MKQGRVTVYRSVEFDVQVHRLYHAGWNLSEVAEHMEAPYGTVRESLFRSRKLAQQIFEHPYGTGRQDHYLRKAEERAQALIDAGVDTFKWRGRPPARQKVPHEELAKMLFLYERMELPPREVGDIMGISASTVLKRLHRLGVTVRDRGTSNSRTRRQMSRAKARRIGQKGARRRGKRVLTPAQVQTAVHLYTQEMMSTTEIAEYLVEHDKTFVHVTFYADRQLIRVALHHAGVKMRTRSEIAYLRRQRKTTELKVAA